MVLALALEEKLHAKKSVITGFFAILCLLLGVAFDLLPVGVVVNTFHEEIFLPVYIPAIDWGVIAIILGSSLFVDITASPFVVFATAITLFMSARLFGIHTLQGQEERQKAIRLVSGFDENDGTESRFFSGSVL